MTTQIPDEKRIRFRGELCLLFWSSKERASVFSDWLNSQPTNATFSLDTEGHITHNGERGPCAYFGTKSNWGQEVVDWLNAVNAKQPENAP